MADAKNTQITTATPARLVEMAITQGADVDKLEKLMEMQERWEANEAKKAYVSAVSAFRSEVPAIEKTRKAHNSKYAGLAETIDIIKPMLVKYGLSHSWRTSQTEGRVSVTCCVTHVMGHQECTALEGAPDTSGSKNSIQAIGSTVSYLERYTLFAILGLASSDEDDDAGRAGKPRITDEQALAIEAMLSDNEIPRDKFMAWLLRSIKADSISDIAADAYDAVVRQINASIKAKRK